MATDISTLPPGARFAQALKFGPSGAQMGLLLTLASALTLAAGVLFWAMRPSFVPLGDRLGERSSGDIVNYLRARDLPFEIDDRSGMILVPDDKLRELRMQLATDGLSSTDSAGIDSLQQNQSLGTSQFMEQARYQHALEKELGRTISNLRGVDSVRVHLAMTKRSSFVRNRSKSSASVMLKMTPGRVLDEGQIQGIVHLIATSVPYMELSRVSVVDHWGRLLSKENDGSALGLSSRQFEFTRNYEQTYIERIESLLSPIVGRGKVQAKVNLTLDFTQNQRRDEIYSGNPQKMRSEQIQDQSSGSASFNGGIPGALTNQPPAGGTLGTADSQTADALISEEGSASAGNFNKSTTRNYELDKTVTSTQDAPGRLLKLSVAVIIDDLTEVDKKGKVTRTSRSPDDLKSITDLVKEAVGFDAKRGDSVMVVNKPFELAEILEPPPAPEVWEQSWFSALIKNVFAAILIALVLLMVIRPALRSLTNKEAAATGAIDNSPTAELARLGSDSMSTTTDSSEPLAAPPRVYGDILNLAREMAADDPRRVATVLRQWVDADG